MLLPKSTQYLSRNSWGIFAAFSNVLKHCIETIPLSGTEFDFESKFESDIV
jgi:hypothetical protein